VGIKVKHRDHVVLARRRQEVAPARELGFAAALHALLLEAAEPVHEHVVQAQLVRKPHGEVQARRVERHAERVVEGGRNQLARAALVVPHSNLKVRVEVVVGNSDKRDMVIYICCFFL
jgi:hypothetical protein